MDLNAVLAVLIGILIRFGLPTLVTALIVWSLKRLDARWQAEIADRRIHSMEGVSVQKIKCWDLMNCSEGQREDCIAFNNPSIPCWQLYRNGNGELRQKCLECEIFRVTPITVAA